MQTIVFILGAILLVLILWIFPHLQLKFSKADIKGKDRIELKNKLRLTLAQILGGAFILGGLFFTWQSLNVSKEGQITERFTRAIEQLGDDELQIRLGGIYALERIAKDSKRDHWPIMEILTVYIRTRAPWPAENREEKESLTEKKTPPPDIQAILTVIGRRTHTSKEEKVLMLSNTDLRGADLREANLREANLTGGFLPEADLEGVSLSKASLSGAALFDAVLIEANLTGADLSKAYFVGADLTGADLSEANLGGAWLSEANLYKANLSDANLEGALFVGADLSEADLSEADLRGADLIKANLRGANLSGAKNLSVEMLKEARSWLCAIYNEDFLTKLGLPSDHNDRASRRTFSEYNLSGANLIDADLRGVFFDGANLSEADLSEADLSKAYFVGADLTGAYLEGANLRGANLSEADLNRANLRKTIDLTVEQLSKVKTLYEAKLDPELEKQIKEKYPHLLEEPKTKKEK